LKSSQQKKKALRKTVTMIVGDARDLSMFADQSFDMVICNSVIEHVGNWLDMRVAANEARRVGKRGWFQAPAFEFPLEQHFLLPFIHWLADPLQVSIIKLFRPSFKALSVDDQYMAVYHTRPAHPRAVCGIAAWYRHAFRTAFVPQESRSYLVETSGRSRLSAYPDPLISPKIGRL
jgi:ubiquinone/menaquinone biosynthesis C-methylase UbiE